MQVWGAERLMHRFRIEKLLLDRTWQNCNRLQTRCIKADQQVAGHHLASQNGTLGTFEILTPLTIGDLLLRHLGLNLMVLLKRLQTWIQQTGHSSNCSSLMCWNCGPVCQSTHIGMRPELFLRNGLTGFLAVVSSGEWLAWWQLRGKQCNCTSPNWLQSNSSGGGQAREPVREGKWWQKEAKHFLQTGWNIIHCQCSFKDMRWSGGRLW